MIPLPWTTTDPFELSLISAIQQADKPSIFAALAHAPARWASTPARVHALDFCARLGFAEGIDALLSRPAGPPPLVSRMPSWSRHIGAVLLRPILAPQPTAPKGPLPNPLMAAIAEGTPACVKMLALPEFCSGASDERGMTPLMAAASSQSPHKADFIRWLLPLSNLQDLGPDGLSPLAMASGLPNAEALSLLVDLFDVNQHTDLGDTPLSLAAGAGLLDNVKILLPLSAASRNDFGPTASERARAAGHHDISEFLDDHWAARAAKLALSSVGQKLERSKPNPAPLADPTPLRRSASP